MPKPLMIDLVSDVVCPWCFIGSRRLGDALSKLQSDVAAEVVYHPFLLDPTTPDEGVDLRDRLRKKYGVDPDSMFGRVESVAREAGIPLDFAKVRRSVSTTRAHTLLRLARKKGEQKPLADALFAAYFLEGRDIGSPEVVAEIGAAHGFSAVEARTLIGDPGELEETRRIAESWGARGVTGVPFFVFGGTVSISGAQSVDVLRKGVEKALSLA